MSTISRLALGMIACAVLLTAGNAANACEQDNDCKNGRICLNGACIAAPASMPAPAPALVGTRCMREKDCPGDEVCSNGVCTEALAPQGPAPAASAPSPSFAPTAPAAPGATRAPSRSCERDGDCSIADVCQERRCVPFAQRKTQASPARGSSSSAASSPSSSSGAQSEYKGLGAMRAGSTATPAPADAPSGQSPSAREPFGKQGQVVPLGSISFSRSSDNYPDSMSGGPGIDVSRTTIGFSPGLEVFVADHIFLGGRIGITKSSASIARGAGTDSTTLSVGPLLGFNVPLGDVASITMGGEFNYHTQSESTTDGTGSTNDKPGQTWLSVKVRIHVLFHVASHMFLGFGPYYDRELNKTRTAAGQPDVDQVNVSTLGISTVIGAWF